MAARCFADTGGLDSDDELADTGSQSAAADAAAAHHRAVTAAAIAGSIQGSPLAAKVRPPAPPAVINTSRFQQGEAWQVPPVIDFVSSPPKHRNWQTPQASSAGAAAMIPKKKGPTANGAASSSTAALTAAAHSTAAAVEQLAQMASERAQKPSCPVSSADGGRQKPNPSANAIWKAKAMAKIGPTLPVLDHAVAAASGAVESSAQSSALPPARPKPVTFAARYPPADPGRKAAWDNMVRDYDKQKEEDKKNGTKRRMTQGEWYTQHAVGYGLQIRKKQAAMKQPSAHPGGPSAGEDNGAGGAEVSLPGISDNGEHEVQEVADEEEEEEEEKEADDDVGEEELDEAIV